MNKTGDGHRAPATVHHSLVFAEKVRVSTRALKNHLPRFRGRPVKRAGFAGLKLGLSKRLGRLLPDGVLFGGRPHRK